MASNEAAKAPDFSTFFPHRSPTPTRSVNEAFFFPHLSRTPTRSVNEAAARRVAFDVSRQPARCRHFEKGGDGRRRHTFYFLLFTFYFFRLL